MLARKRERQREGERIKRYFAVRENQLLIVVDPVKIYFSRSYSFRVKEMKNRFNF